MTSGLFFRCLFFVFAALILTPPATAAPPPPHHDAAVEYDPATRQLSIVDRIAAAHHGCVNAANCAEGGAAFTLRIPRGSVEAAA